MHRSSVQSLIALGLAAHLSVGMAANLSIGVAIAQGNFAVDGSKVIGNTTLFEGNTVATGERSSELHFNNGARMQLGSESRGKVFQDRMILEKGRAEFANFGKSKSGIEALSLRISQTGSQSSARVVLRGEKTVQVAALTGSVRVVNARGVLLANLPAGRALDFEPQEAGAVAPNTITGLLTKSGGHYFVKDETSNVVIEVLGSGVGQLDKEVGKRVQITGTLVVDATPAEGATQVLQVTDLKYVGKVAPSGAGGTAAGTAAGLSVGTKAIIAGVIVAGAATGGTVAALKRNDNKPSTLSVAVP